jgi:diguanylate cyclase (GGDEF)-like protein
MQGKIYQCGIIRGSALSTLCRIRHKIHWSGEIRNRAKSGELGAEWLTFSSVKDEQGKIINYVCVFSSVTHLINQRHHLEQIAYHDALTGLPNRLLLSDRLELSIAHAERNNDSLAVCYLDLDGFKPVNDSLGHAAGDEVLRVISQRLKKVVRGDDTIARMGGDEFVILLGNQKSTSNYMDLLDRLLHEAALPIQIQNDTAKVTASIGVSFFPKDGDKPESLLQCADEAMYQAKRLGKSRYNIYQPAKQPLK